MMNLWQFSQNVSPETREGVVAEPQTGRNGEFRVTGYFWMMDTRTGRSYHPQGTPKKDWVTTLNCKKPVETELVLDAMLSTGADAKTTSFTQVQGGTWGRWHIWDRTNHLMQGDNPAGANIIFIDGHLDWRRFNEMQVRVSPPYHWW